MDLVQVYETTIYNRDDRRAYSFVTVPSRSFSERMQDVDVADVAGMLDLHDAREPSGRPLRVQPVEAWSLPFLIDATLGRFVEYPYEFGFYFDPLEPRRPRRGPSPFAQYVTFAPVIPFESSPLGGKALAELVTAGGGVGGAVGAYMTGDPLLLLVAVGGIILGGAARGVGDALHIGLRSKLLDLMGVEDPDARSPNDGE